MANIDNVAFNRLTFKELSEVTSPNYGSRSIYCNSDGQFFARDSSGNDTPLVGGSVRDVSYNELLDMLYNYDIIPGQIYCIYDFSTAYYMVLGSDYIQEDPCYGYTERLLVFGLTSNSISRIAYSLDYPDDIIFYDPYSYNWESDPAFYRDYSVITDFKGVIYFRHDTVRDIYTWYDFRAVKFRRWTIEGQLYDPSKTYNIGEPCSLELDPHNIYICAKSCTGIPPEDYSDNWCKLHWSGMSDILTPFPEGSTYYDYYTFGGIPEYMTHIHIERADIQEGESILTNNVLINDANSPFSTRNVTLINCRNSTFGDQCSDNIFRNLMACSIGAYAQYNDIGSMGTSEFSIVGSYFQNNNLGSISHSIIGSDFVYNRSGSIDECVICNSTYDLDLGRDAYKLRIGKDCYETVIHSVSGEATIPSNTYGVIFEPGALIASDTGEPDYETIPIDLSNWSILTDKTRSKRVVLTPAGRRVVTYDNTGSQIIIDPTVT